MNFGQISRDSWICMCQGENLIKCYTLYEMNISITCIYRKIVFNFSANLASIGNKTHSLLNLYLINVKMFMKNDAIINQLVFILCETLILYVFIQIWMLLLDRTSASDISSFIQEIFSFVWILDSLSAIMQHFSFFQSFTFIRIAKNLFHRN